MRVYLDNCCNRPFFDQAEVRISLESQAKLHARERFDYTKWRRKHFNNVNADDFNNAAAKYAHAHPFQLKKALIPIE